MTDKVRCEVFLVIDEDGNYAVGVDYDQAKEMYNDNIGDYGPRRVIKRTFLVTPPQVEDTGEADVVDTDGETVEVEEEVAERQSA